MLDIGRRRSGLPFGHDFHGGDQFIAIAIAIDGIFRQQDGQQPAAVLSHVVWQVERFGGAADNQVDDRFATEGRPSE